mmetsp:Transcript_101143/g.286638  ORF Transcript_101143/g.286638 Transcript_101143/m.286638 type:complete len:259 (-) Transcript_101143:19-795(-)
MRTASFSTSVMSATIDNLPLRRLLRCCSSVCSFTASLLLPSERRASCESDLYLPFLLTVCLSWGKLLVLLLLPLLTRLARSGPSGLSVHSTLKSSSSFASSCGCGPLTAKLLLKAGPLEELFLRGSRRCSWSPAATGPAETSRGSTLISTLEGAPSASPEVPRSRFKAASSAATARLTTMSGSSPFGRMTPARIRFRDDWSSNTCCRSAWTSLVCRLASLDSTMQKASSSEGSSHKLPDGSITEPSCPCRCDSACLWS